jgi:hypothetical protein
MLRRVVPRLSGVHLVEAGKSFYGASPALVGRSTKRWATARDAPAALHETV